MEQTTTAGKTPLHFTRREDAESFIERHLSCDDYDVFEGADEIGETGRYLWHIYREDDGVYCVDGNLRDL